MKLTVVAVTLLVQGITVSQGIARGQALAGGENVASYALGPNWSGFGSPDEQQPAGQPQPAQTASASSDASRPRTEGSMIGYLEDATIGSQVRIRSEGGFDAQFPDRAEFFYAKCGCFKSNLAGSGLPAFDPKSPGPGPGVVTKLNFQQLYMQGEYAPHRRLSVFVEVPIRWIQPMGFVPGFGSFGNQGGLGDVTAGVKAAIIASRKQYLTVQLKSYFPSGDASKGLSTGHYSIEPSLLYYQALPNRMALESEIGIWAPIGGAAGVASATNSTPQGFAGNILFYGVGPSYQLVRREHFHFSPVVELVGWSVLGGFQTVWISATRTADLVGGTNIVNIKIGARTDIGGGNSFYIGYGRALTSAVWYSDLVRFEFRHAFR